MSEKPNPYETKPWLIDAKPKVRPEPYPVDYRLDPEKYRKRGQALRKVK